jgi:lipoyl(octanoyl) transferase
MPSGPQTAESPSPAVETFLLGQVPFAQCLELQERLRRQVAQRDDGQIIVLMCEHPEVITIGRGGRPSHVSPTGALRSRQIDTHWTNRGGGCLVHCPGQLAVYAILPLRQHGFTLGDYLGRLQAALAGTLAELGVQVHVSPGRFGVWGRTGQIAYMGVAVRDGVTWHGAFVNVSPAMGLFRLVQSDPAGHSCAGSIAAERCGVVRMATVRAVLVRHLAESLGCDRYHLYTGHPWLASRRAARAVTSSPSP